MTVAFIPLTAHVGSFRPSHAVYVRRRLLVALVSIGLLAVLGTAVRSLLTDRGGVPASASAVRPASVPPAALPPTAADAAAGAASSPLAVAGTAAAAATSATAGATPAVQPLGAGRVVHYIVQPGDTLWSLGEQFHGAQSVSSYVEALVDRNGGASLEVGQLLTMP